MSPPNSQSSNGYEDGNQLADVVYDRNSIISRLSTVDPSVHDLMNASPPGSVSLKRQRSEQEDVDGKLPPSRERSSKRWKGGSEQYSVIDCEEEVIFAVNEAASQQKPVSNTEISDFFPDDLTNYLRKAKPPFNFREPTIEKGYHGYPMHVNALLKYMSQMREDFIPGGLKVDTGTRTHSAHVLNVRSRIALLPQT